MAGKKPRPACVEDFDEDEDDIVPESRQVANTAAKVVTRSDHRFPAEPLIDVASDSGYSSRTAATANSTQSGPSGGKSPPAPLKLDMPKQRADLARKGSTRQHRKDKERSRPSHDESMRVGAYPGPAQYHSSHVPRSPSKSRRRDRRDSTIRQYHDVDYHYEGGAPIYHPSSTSISTPVDRFPPGMEYAPPYSYLGRPPMPDFGPSSPRGPPRWAQGYEEYHRPSNRTSRSNSYRHSGGYHHDRPMSMGIHEMSSMVPPMYPPSYGYEQYGPPPSNSAFYSSSPYGQGSYTGGYAGSEYGAPSEYPRERSRSRPPRADREPSRSRRASVYERHPLDQEVFQDFEEMEPIERYSSREIPRGHSSKYSQGRDEDYYKMPPPPAPAPKPRAAPQIHQAKRPDPPRKSQTVQTIPARRSSRAADRMDMSEIANALPDYATRRLSREAGIMPERSQSLRDSKRSSSYHDTGRGARVAVENSRRRRPDRSEQYYYEARTSHASLEDQERGIEEYQAAKSGRTPGQAALPMSTESLIPMMASGAGSDNGSQKSRSNSSRGSGSGTGSKAGADKNISLVMDGVQLGFTEEAVQGKSINIRSGDAGGFHLSIGGSRKQKAYLPAGSSYSDHTGTASRRELEDVRRPRDDRRSERSSRRASQSTYGRNRF
ncbi:hypothetical protein N7532_003093 [Penicillium argentinense]|uniref:Uncharacterized protein n=1 Tax=Penicillium argentinense TaxID=1131581 RepID=A0A9W9FLR4_9EURO|nr:uncharacterized protein N7532_003093 [Penicillium argentinense]KAJ5102564.1 hypothetical protein N7532_003093 [Penicillium argentinense]